MKKLVISMAVDMDDATFAKVCMACGGFARIPGTELFQLPEFAAVNLAKILEKGVREENPVPLPVLGAESAVKQEAATAESSVPATTPPPMAVTLGEASKDPVVKERATGLIGSALGLRGKRGPHK